MKSIYAFTTAAIIGISFIACNKHEIIPAPDKKVELEPSFRGKVGGTVIEFIKDVNGYDGLSTHDFLIFAGALDTGIYYSEMSSTQSIQKIKIGLGSIVWDASTSPTPSLDVFNAFCRSVESPFDPPYKIDARNGFMVSYTDQAGREWRSNENHALATESVSFYAIVQESDETGDYSKFICNFDTYVYREPDPINFPGVFDSLLIEDAQFKCWFKR